MYSSGRFLWSSNALALASSAWFAYVIWQEMHMTDESDQTKKIYNQILRDMEKPTPEALYHQLGRLRNEMPNWSLLGNADSSQWSGRILAVVEAAGCTVELVTLRTYFDYAARNKPHQQNGILIAQQVDAVLAKLELRLPVQMQGAFIPAGGVHDGYQAISKALALAQKHVFLVEPYGDDTLISDFVPLAPEGLPVFVMSDEQYAKPSLKPAAARWVTQWGAKRPLEVRLTPPRALHDRLVILDSSTAYVLGQSFKDLAKRAHSSLVRMDAESGQLKINAHIAIWQTATKLA